MRLNPLSTGKSVQTFESYELEEQIMS